MIVYRFAIETPWAGCEHEEEVEFDTEPTDKELDAVLSDIYANNFPAGWERMS